MSDKTLKELTVDAHIAVLHTKVDALIEKQKELTERVRANEKVVAALGVLGTIAIAFIGAGAFAPRAEACSMPLDGIHPHVCPPHDGILDDVFVKSSFEDNISKETETPDYYTKEVTVWDSREPQKWDTGSVIQGMRDWKAAQNRTPVNESINNALVNLDWNDYGSDDPTEQEELLQLSSGID